MTRMAIPATVSETEVAGRPAHHRVQAPTPIGQDTPVPPTPQ